MTTFHFDLILSGDYAQRVQHFASLGLRSHEISRMLNIPEDRVSLIIRAVDERTQYTTSNC